MYTSFASMYIYIYIYIYMYEHTCEWSMHTVLCNTVLTAFIDMQKIIDITSNNESKNQFVLLPKQTKNAYLTVQGNIFFVKPFHL